MLFIYRILGCLLLPLFVLRGIYKNLKNKQKFHYIKQNLGFIDVKKTYSIWLHAVSLGEARASIPIINHLLKNHPHINIWVTTTTPTGKKALEDVLTHQRIKHSFCPYDSYIPMRRFLNKLKPKIMLVMETEIWPNALTIAKTQGCKSFLINARLSNKSCRNYNKKIFKNLSNKVINSFDTIISQTPEDKRNYQKIGFYGNSVISGNIKFDSPINSQKYNNQQKLSNKLTFVAVSLRKNEQQPLLNAFKIIHNKINNSQCIVIPRHLHLIDEIKKTSAKQDLSFEQINKPEQIYKTKNNVVAVNAMGCVLDMIAIADIVFVGGSLVKTGGQNIIEPIALEKPVCIGYSYYNFKAIVNKLIENKAIMQVNNYTELAEAVINLHQNTALKNAIVTNATKVFKNSQGSLKIALNVIDTAINNIKN